MNHDVPTLIQKNKEAFDKHCFIEAMCLSHVLINKALKQVIREEHTGFQSQGKYKMVELIDQVEDLYKKKPTLKSKLKHTVVKEIDLFNTHYKTVMKELKFQYPEEKIRHASALGMKVLAMMNTTLLKMKNNKSLA